MLFEAFVIFATICTAIKVYMKMTIGVCKSTARMDGKTVIITGSNTGIGLETAKDLARRGAKVVLACRNSYKANKAIEEIKRETGSSSTYTLRLDLASLQSVRQFVEEFNTREDRLDVLINNAGMVPKAEGVITEDGLEMTFQTNHFSPFLLTMLLLPKLKSTGLSRIVNISSLAYVFTDKLDFRAFTRKGKKMRSIFTVDRERKMSTYCESKLCNILFTKSLARRLEGSSVTVNCLHPGLSSTGMKSNFNLIELFCSPQSPLLRPLFHRSVRESAQTAIYLAVDPDLEKVNGKFFAECGRFATKRLANDMELAEKLWNESIKLTVWLK